MGSTLPSKISSLDGLYFAIDNTDLQMDTPDGKRQLHGTAMAVYQQKMLSDDDKLITLVTYIKTNEAI